MGSTRPLEADRGAEAPAPRRLVTAAVTVATAAAMVAALGTAVVLHGRDRGAAGQPGAGVPSPRAGAAMALDPATGQVILFGGGAYTSFGDTWAWDGHGWDQLHPAHHPTARENAAMAYDAATGQLLLFGGDSDDETVAPRLLADTWAWNGTDWSRLHPASTPPAADTPRMAYDPTAREVVVLTQFCYCPAGGDPSTTQTWTWDGREWTRRSPAHSPSGEGPGAGAEGAPGELSRRPVAATGCCPGGDTTAMATDPATGHAVVVQHVEYANTVPLPVATWTWTGDDWDLAPVHDAPSPAPNSPMLAADPARGRLVYLDAAAQLWAWRGSGWTRIAGAPAALHRGDAAMAVDAGGELVVFGGVAVAPGGLHGDTWTWSDAGGWHHAAGPDGAVAVVPPPVARPSHGITSAQAVRLAAKQLPGSTPVRAVAGPARDFLGPGEGAPGGARYVWAVLVDGSFSGSCGPPPPPGGHTTCPPPATTAMVLLDYVTGEFVNGRFPAPPQLVPGS